VTFHVRSTAIWECRLNNSKRGTVRTYMLARHVLDDEFTTHSNSELKLKRMVLRRNRTMAEKASN